MISIQLGVSRVVVGVFEVVVIRRVKKSFKGAE